jgi:hypothetical protein
VEAAAAIHCACRGGISCAVSCLAGGVVGVLPWVWVQAVRGFKGCTCSAVYCRCSAPLASRSQLLCAIVFVVWSHVGWCCGTVQRALCVGAFSLLTA